MFATQQQQQQQPRAKVFIPKKQSADEKQSRDYDQEEALDYKKYSEGSTQRAPPFDPNWKIPPHKSLEALELSPTSGGNSNYNTLQSGNFKSQQVLDQKQYGVSMFSREDIPIFQGTPTQSPQKMAFFPGAQGGQRPHAFHMSHTNLWEDEKAFPEDEDTETTLRRRGSEEDSRKNPDFEKSPPVKGKSDFIPRRMPFSQGKGKPKSFKKSTTPFYSKADLSEGMPPAQVSFDDFFKLIKKVDGVGFRPFTTISSDAGNDKWFYIDNETKLQGGFTCEQMDTWYSLKYFDGSLKIALNEPTTFKTLSGYVEAAAQAAYNLYFHNKPVQPATAVKAQ